MKKSVIALALLVSVCCLSSCSNGDVSTSSDADKSSSMASSAQSSSKTDKKSDKKTSSNLEDELFELEDDIDSIYHTPTSDYPSWTFEDWMGASEDQRKQCLDYFSLEVGRDIDESNLSKIFATNLDKTLAEIIDIQKSNTRSSSKSSPDLDDLDLDFMQPDPGHGAAAGQDID